MAFAVCSDITIGKFEHVKPHEVKINKSIYEYVDRAVIKLPITARIIRAGEVITASAETAKQFTEGDKVVIKLGYNGDLKQEFIGFISRVNFKQPLEVECEGYSYQLRKKTFKGTVKNIELKDLLKKIIADTDIVLADNIPGFPIDKIVLEGKDGCQILESIRGASRQNIRFFFLGNELWGGHQYVNIKNTVRYQMGWNVIKDGNLKLRQANSQKAEINWVGVKKDGSKVKVKTGKGGVVKTHTSHMFTDKTSLQQLSDSEHKHISFDGYEGKITAYGIPFCQPNYAAKVDDAKYKERSGQYIVENIEVSYGMSGFRRTVGIGAKLL